MIHKRLDSGRNVAPASGYVLKVITYLFGERPSTQATKAVFYVAWLSMLPTFWSAKWHGIAWMNITMPLVLLSFFTVGVFCLLSSRESLIDFWRPSSRLGKELADPSKGSGAVRSFRVVGSGFILFVTYIACTTLRGTKHS